MKNEIEEENENEIFVRRFLEKQGFKVNRLNSTGKKIADYEAIYNTENYLFEVKTKEDSKEHNSAIKNLKGGEVFLEDEIMTYQNKMEHILDYSRKQLNSTSKDPSIFKIIWFMAIGRNPKDQLEQVEKTFYGSMDLYSGISQLKPCYYFLPSLCYKYKEIDAVITS